MNYDIQGKKYSIDRMFTELHDCAAQQHNVTLSAAGVGCARKHHIVLHEVQCAKQTS